MLYIADIYKYGSDQEIIDNFAAKSTFCFSSLLRCPFQSPRTALCPQTAHLVFVVDEGPTRFLFTIVIQTLLLSGALGLSVRDAIAEEGTDAYDAFMSSVATTSFLSLDHNNNTITVYEHNGADDSVIRSGTFAASHLASSYFEQEREMALDQGLQET